MEPASNDASLPGKNALLYTEHDLVNVSSVIALSDKELNGTTKVERVARGLKGQM